MLTKEELAEVTDETALLLRGIVARQSSDLAISFVEVLGLCFMAYHDQTLPENLMVEIRKSLERFPRLENHIDVLAVEAIERANEKRKG